MAILTYLSPLVSVPVKVTIIGKNQTKTTTRTRLTSLCCAFSTQTKDFFLDILMFCVGKVKC